MCWKGATDANAVKVLKLLFFYDGATMRHCIPLPLKIELRLLFPAAQFHLRAMAIQIHTPCETTVEPTDAPELIGTFEHEVLHLPDSGKLCLEFRA